jgi:hypothetical protein
MITFDELTTKIRRAHNIPSAVGRAVHLVALFPALEFHDIFPLFRSWTKLRRIVSAIVLDKDFIAFRSLVEASEAYEVGSLVR